MRHDPSPTCSTRKEGLTPTSSLSDNGYRRCESGQVETEDCRQSVALNHRRTLTRVDDYRKTLVDSTSAIRCSAMTSEESIESAISHHVDAGQLAGAAALVWRDGRVVQTVSVGRRDLTTGMPVERDTIFRVASMTKPVTTVAALMLLDERRFYLDEPIAGLLAGTRPHARPARSGGLHSIGPMRRGRSRFAIS